MLEVFYLLSGLFWAIPECLLVLNQFLQRMGQGQLWCLADSVLAENIPGHAFSGRFDQS
jgi:hypothetical protein